VAREARAKGGRKGTPHHLEPTLMRRLMGKKRGLDVNPPSPYPRLAFGSIPVSSRPKSSGGNDSTIHHRSDS